jgi:hypothetical protein
MSDFLATYKKTMRRQYVWIGALLALALIGEMAFDLVERAVGKYLIWQNASRSKTGRSWEQEQQRSAAGVRLENVFRERRRQALELESISNLEELVQYVETNQQAALPPAQFLQIYRELPYFLQPLLVDPDSLVADARSQKLATILADGNRSLFNLIMLDSYNQTLRRATLSVEKIGWLVNYGKEQPLSVHRVARFADYLFDRARFWDLFERLHPLRRRQFIQAVPLLMESAGQITAVGISNSPGEFVEVAFAVSDNRACVYYLPEDYVMDLLSPDRERAFQFYRMRRPSN